MTALGHQVFVSHATPDRDMASQVCELLEAGGISCWLASRDVEAGSDYAASIVDAIRDSSLVVLIFSKHANASPYVLREIERAIAYDHPVLSLRVDDAAPTDSMEYYLNLWQWLDIPSGVDRQRREIAAAVREQLDKATTAGTGLERTFEIPGAETGSRRLRGWRLWGSAVAGLILLAAVVAVGIWVATRGHSPAQASSDTSINAANARTELSSGPLYSRDSWTKLSPIGTLPPARSTRPLVFDPTSGRLVMFGGAHSDGAGDFLDDTWAYDPASNAWTNLSPTGTMPPARVGLAMVYVPATHRLVMFGGHLANNINVNDTWTYDPRANTWTKLDPSGSLPHERYGHSMVYVASIGKAILFGGTSADGDPDDTWAYDPAANAWTNLHPRGSPPARYGAPMVYDPITDRVIMFGGMHGETQFFNDTWAYDPHRNTWTELDPSGTVPYARFGPSMVYDSYAGLVIMFGGQVLTDFFNDTWAYDPGRNTWSKLNPSGTLPSPRVGAMGYDPATDQVIMFGGADSASARFNDTYVYTP